MPRGREDEESVAAAARDDPEIAMAVALERARLIDADADPVGHAHARVAIASALNDMTRSGWGDMSAKAAPILDESIAVFEQHLPAAREHLVEARYLAADMRRGRDWEGARDHYEAGLRVVRRETEPAYWAALNEGLAATLVRGPGGDEPEVQERSLALYQEALTVEPPDVPPGHWAATAHGFALTLAERHRGTVIANWASVLEVMGRALEPAFDAGDQVTQRGVFELHARARIAFGLFGLLGSALAVDDALGQVRAGAEALDVLRDPQDALTPAAERLAAAAHSDGDAFGACVEIGLGLLEAIGDRRGLVMLHAMQAAGPGSAEHLAEAERLLSPKDDASLHGAVEHARAALSGSLGTAEEPPAPEPATTEPLPIDDDELPHMQAFLAAQAVLADPGAGNLEIEQALKACRAALAAVRTPGARATGLHVTGMLAQGRTVGDRRANLEDAVASLEAALELPATEVVNRTAVLHNLGVVYKQRLGGVRADNLEAAIRHLEAALAATSLDTDPAQWARTASQLANTYSERVLGDEADNVERALELYGEALELRPRAEQPVEWAITKHNIASTLLQRRLGDERANLAAALTHLGDALEIRTEAALPEHFAMSQDTLADTRLALARSDRERTLEHFDAALAALEAAGRVWTLDRHRPQWLNNRLRLADVHAERAATGAAGDDHERAATGAAGDDHEQAVELVEQVLLTVSPEAEPHQLQIAHDRLATLLARSGDADDLPRAIAGREALLERLTAAGDTSRVSMAAATLGRVLADAERWVEAAAAFRRALEAEADVGQAAVSLTTRWARMRSVAGLHGDAAFAFAQPSSGAHAVEPLVTLERGRTRVLGDTFARDHRRLDALERLGPDAAAARNAFLDAAAAMSDLATAELGAGGLGGSAPTAAVRDEGRRVRRRLADAKAAIQRVPGFESFLEPPGVETIHEAARGGRPLVHLWATGRGALAVATVDDGSGGVHYIGTRLLLKSTDVDKVLLPEPGWPGLLVAQREGGEVLDAVLQAVLPPLGHTIAAPLRGLLARLRADGALLVPCGRLGALPILAAPYGSAPGCLLDDFALELTPSASVAEAVRSARPEDGGRRYVAVADTRPAEAPLRWAAPEVLDVARAALADAPLVGPAATRERVVDAIRGADVVHLACHGHFDVAAPERSRLVLADGDLAVTEMLSARLLEGVRLVIASACESGAADVTGLPDEATGLPAALLQAGAAHVLGTLWPVSDLSAALLVSRVAEACLDPGADPAAELATAQRWLRDLGRGEALTAARRLAGDAGATRPELEDDLAWLELAAPDRPFAAPRHWAPFVLFGA